MRKWLVCGIVMLLTPWLMSLVWMHTAGQAVEARKAAGASENAGVAGNAGAAENAGVAGNAGASGTAEALENAGEAEAAGAAGTTEAADIAGAAVGGEAAQKLAGAPPDAVKASSDGAINRKILIERNGIRTYMPLEEYLPGVIVCQMNPGYGLEALKCQAVIARTYIYRLMNGRTEINEEELDLDYLGEDTGIRPGGITLGEKEQMAENLSRCSQAAKETAGIIMKYEDRYVLPLFHAISAGRTRKGEEDYPYLQAVDSRWDTQRADYAQTFEWSRAEFARIISQIPDAQPVSEDQLPDQIQTVKKDDSEYVLQMKIGARTYTGEEIQYALNLPSSCFMLDGEADGIRAAVRGSGHGYGLSQAGADSMAADGWAYENILNYYYKNISLVTE